MGLETLNNAYLGSDTSLVCSADTAADVDREVLQLIKKAHEKARKIITDNMEILHSASSYLLEKETITGEEFMRIVERSKKNH